LHQRGRAFQIFSSLEVLFNSSLTIVSSYMSEALGWRSWYWLFTALSGACFIVAFVFVPETDYPRPLSAYMGTHAPVYVNIDPDQDSLAQDTAAHARQREEPLTTLSERNLDTQHFKARTWQSDMRIFVIKPDFRKAIVTWKQMFEIWFFPHVLWVTLMNGFFQGTDVCIQITYGSALVSPPYNWANTTVSLIQIGQIIVALLAIPIIGLFSDSFIQRKARSNRGVHEPEQRLAPLIAPLLICIMMTVIYGFAIQYPEKYHWFALAFTVNIWLFLLLAASTVGTTYLLDAHPARAGAIMVVIPVTRGLVSFGISYHTVDYVNAVGAANTFGILSGIMGLFGLVGVVFYFKGKQIRHIFSKWAS
jgi:MFS family permease